MAIYLDSTFISTYVPQRVEGAGMGPGLSYVDAFAIELSRELVAFSASIWEPDEVSTIQTVTEKLGSRILIVPLTLYVSAVLLYRFVFPSSSSRLLQVADPTPPADPNSAVTLGIAVTALAAARSTSFVHLAHFRLTSPMALVHDLSGSVDPARTWKEDGLGVFSHESDGDRLNVGPVTNSRGETAFGVRKVDS